MSNQFSKFPYTTVVIVTYNSARHIGSCLDSLLKSQIPVNQVVIVDNCSQDKTLKEIPRIRKIVLSKNTRNVGFGKAVNQGIRKARKNNDILLLNPDTLLRRNSLIKLFRSANTNNSGIVGGKLLKPDGLVHGSFVRRPNFWTIVFDYTNLRKLVPSDYFHRKHYYADYGVIMRDHDVDAVSGAFMYIRRQVIDSVGFFDENFFMYLEDIDYCLRAQEAGFKITYCPESIIKHTGGASSDNKHKINYAAWTSSRIYFVSKYFPMLPRLLLKVLIYMDDLLTKLQRVFQ